MEASGACSHAALSVRAFLDKDEEWEQRSIMAWIARFTLKAASDPDVEMKLQSNRLIELLLE